MSQVDFEQVPYAEADLAGNPEPRCACLLLLDNSGSMSGQPLEELNVGLRQFQDELASDDLAAKRVEVAIVTFGPVEVRMDFTGAQLFQAPRLSVAGDTPMGQAIETGLEMVRARKDAYKKNGIAYYRPWIFLITDGEPTDSYTAAVEALRDGQRRKHFEFFAVGVQGANMTVLKQMSGERAPLNLKGLQFREMFRWLSNSLSAKSRSQVLDAPVAVENPTAPQGWASI